MNTKNLTFKKGKGHYDYGLEDNIKLYDHQPYYRDISLCSSDSIKLISGNIIKYYRCKIKESVDSPSLQDNNNKGSHKRK